MKVPFVLVSGLLTRLSAAGLPDVPLEAAGGVFVLVVGVKPKLNDGATTGSVNSVDKAGTSTCSFRKRRYKTLCLLWPIHINIDGLGSLSGDAVLPRKWIQ